MRSHNLDQRRNGRVETPGGEIAGVVRFPRVHDSKLFPGWGPKLFGFALAALAVASFAVHAGDCR